MLQRGELVTADDVSGREVLDEARRLRDAERDNPDLIQRSLNAMVARGNEVKLTAAQRVKPVIEACLSAGKGSRLRSKAVIETCPHGILQIEQLDLMSR